MLPIATSINELPILEKSGNRITYGNFVILMGSKFVQVKRMVVEYPLNNPIDIKKLSA